MAQIGDGKFEEGLPVEMMFGHNQKGEPSIAFYQQGKFVVQITLSMKEIALGYEFFRSEYRKYSM